MAIFDCRGVPTSCARQSLIDALEDCHIQSLTFQGDPVGAIDRVLKGAPDFVMGHCFKAAMLTQAMEVRVQDALRSSVEAAESLKVKANDRERGHVAALRAWLDGDFQDAIRKWTLVLREYPRDLLALQLVHLSNVLLGDVAGQLSCVERVLAKWDESVPGYEFVLAFNAFGLEENQAYRAAEDFGHHATELRRGHPYANHAVAHVAEMQGRQAKGIAYLNSTRESWANSSFANHNWWHLALYHLDLGETGRVLEIYDNHLRTASGPDCFEDLDSTALLWRLKLLDVDVGSRWRTLATRWIPSARDTHYAFNDVHAMMAFAADERADAVARLLSSNERFAEGGKGTNAKMTRSVGLPTIHALGDFAAERYASCVERLLPIRNRSYALGGSSAQRDVINWTLVEAALRARQYDRALWLAQERCAGKRTSPQNWVLVARALRGLGRSDDAAEAMAVSRELVAS